MEGERSRKERSRDVKYTILHDSNGKNAEKGILKLRCHGNGVHIDLQSKTGCLAPKLSFSFSTTKKTFNPFTATGYFHRQPPRWLTFLAMLFQILKEGMGLPFSDELEVQYHVIKKLRYPDI